MASSSKESPTHASSARRDPPGRSNSTALAARRTIWCGRGRRAPIVNRALPLYDWEYSQPDRECIVTDARAYTWREIAEAVRRLAAHLADSVSVGTRVGLYIDSTPAFIIAQHAVFHLGGIVAPINRAIRESEVRDLVDHLEIDAVITDTVGDFGAPTLSLEGEAPMLGESPAPPIAQIDVTAGAMLLQTSGSTGRPKGVLLSVANLLSNYDATYRWLGIGRDDRLLLALPVFNTYGLNQGINLLMQTGAVMRLVRRFDVDTMRAVLEVFRPTFLPLVPTMVTRLRQADIRFDAPLRLGIGSASSPSQITTDAWAVFPQAHIFFGYGLTEATAIVSVHHVGTPGASDRDHASVGPIVPGMEVAIDDAEGAGRGEVVVRGDAVFAAYLGTTEQRPVVDGWLQTGDIGTFRDGHLYIVDRKRDLIIRGGQNIYPGEVERALSAHEGVLEAAVVSAPDADLGEVPVAFIVPRKEHAIDSEQLLDWLGTRLARFKVPTQIVQVESMPKTPTGKILKRELRVAAAALGSSDDDELAQASGDLQNR